jgi:hypothetical protein
MPGIFMTFFEFMVRIYDAILICVTDGSVEILIKKFQAAAKNIEGYKRSKQQYLNERFLNNIPFSL